MKKEETVQKKPDDLKVFIASRESKYEECGEELGSRAWIMLTGETDARVSADIARILKTWELREVCYARSEKPTKALKWLALFVCS